MLKIPEGINSSFGSFLSKKNIPLASHNYYKKWLRFYLDYCNKYRFYSLSPSSPPNFLNKLKEKKQTGVQQKQAYEAIHLFYELVGQQPNIKNVLASIEQQKHEIKDIGSNLKPEIHANPPFQKQNSCAHSTKQESNKGETNCNWQNIFLGGELGDVID